MPLVDVMLVLLIIFMVTAPMMQQGLNVNLPQARRADPVNAQPVYVTIPADFRAARIVQIGEEPVRLEMLHERLRQAHPAAATTSRCSSAWTPRCRRRICRRHRQAEARRASRRSG